MYHLLCLEDHFPKLKTQIRGLLNKLVIMTLTKASKESGDSALYYLDRLRGAGEFEVSTTSFSELNKRLKETNVSPKEF